MSATATKRCLSPLRYSDIQAQLWFWSGAPLYWRTKVRLSFHNIDFSQLHPASTLHHWDVLACWTRAMSRNRAIPPLVANRTESGLFYIQDGNHPYAAMRICFRNRLARLRVRVAVLDPLPGYEFVWKQFSTHYTYVLQPTFKADALALPCSPTVAAQSIVSPGGEPCWSL
jgi:hypothetical protein